MEKTFMILKIILLLIFITIPVNSSFSACYINEDDCNYYLCREEIQTCGKLGYIVGYGYKYCLKFNNKLEHFSQQGQEWLIRTRICLQEELEAISYETSCSELKKMSMNTHVTCYINSGFCNLPSKDIIKILKIINFKLFNFKNIAEGIKILNNCKKL